MYKTNVSDKKMFDLDGVHIWPRSRPRVHIPLIHLVYQTKSIKYNTKNASILEYWGLKHSKLLPHSLTDNSV